MLTSSHYWFGGLFAVSCAIGGLAAPASPSLQLPKVSFKEAISESIDVPYRGSGRLEEMPPIQEKTYRHNSSHQKNLASDSLASHRGSGRIRLFCT